MEKSQSKLPARNLTFTIVDNEYVVSYPNTGQLLDIETGKINISRDTYNGLVNTNTNAGAYSKLLIDAIAVLNIICPQLKKDLKVTSILNLDAIDSKEILKVYVKTILPWLNEWESILNQDLFEEVVEEEKTEEKQ
jgi:hypothetical protein